MKAAVLARAIAFSISERGCWVEADLSNEQGLIVSALFGHVPPAYIFFYSEFTFLNQKKASQKGLTFFFEPPDPVLGPDGSDAFREVAGFLDLHQAEVQQTEADERHGKDQLQDQHICKSK